MGQSRRERCRQLSQCLAIAATTGFHTIFTHIEQVCTCTFTCCIIHVVVQLSCMCRGWSEEMSSHAMLRIHALTVFDLLVNMVHVCVYLLKVFGECAVQSLDQLLSTGAPDSMPPQAPSSSLDENRDTSRKLEGQVVKASKKLLVGGGRCMPSNSGAWVTLKAILLLYNNIIGSASVTGTGGLELEDDETNGFFAVLEQNVDEGGSEDRGEVEGGGGEEVEGERDRVESGKEGVVGSEGGEGDIVESGSDGRNDRKSGEVDGEDVVDKGESGEGVEGGGGREVKGESGEGVDIGSGALREEVLYQQLLEGKKEESLEQQVRALFASCSSTTAQESLLLSLRRVAC